MYTMKNINKDSFYFINRNKFTEISKHSPKWNKNKPCDQCRYTSTNNTNSDAAATTFFSLMDAFVELFLVLIPHESSMRNQD